MVVNKEFIRNSIVSFVVQNCLLAFFLLLLVVLPKEHLWEIMAMSGSIHLTKVESLFITLNDSTRLRNTRKSASWDSTTLLLSTPKTTKTEGKLYTKTEGITNIPSVLSNNIFNCAL